MSVIKPDEFKKSGVTFKLEKHTWKDEKGNDQPYQLLKVLYNGGRLKWMGENNTGGITEGQGYALQMPLYLYKDPAAPTEDERALANMYNIIWEEANKFLFDNREELIGNRGKCKTKTMWDEIEYVPKPVFFPKIKDGEKVTNDIDETRTPSVYVKLYMSKPGKDDKTESTIYTKMCDAVVLNEDFQGKEEEFVISVNDLKRCNTTQVNVVWIGDLYISVDKIRWRQTLNEAYVSDVRRIESGNKRDAQKLIKGKKFTKLQMPKRDDEADHKGGKVNKMNPDDSPPGSPGGGIKINGDELN